MSMKLTAPLPGTDAVTSTLVQVSGTTGPDLPASAEGFGALA